MNMADTTTWIKIDRKLLKWRWFKDNNTLKVWLFLLISANYKPCEFEDMTVQRGQIVTSYNSIASQTFLTYDEVRTAISHLKRTGEITYLRRSNFLVISIGKYNDYQGASQTSSQSFPNRFPDPSQSLPNNIRNINNEERKNIYARAREWEDEECVPPGLRGRFASREAYINYRDGVPDEV